MGTANAISRKIKGKAQQIQGEIQQHTGQEFKGTIQKIKGKANELLSDIELRSKDKTNI